MARRTLRGFAWTVFPNAKPPGDETQPGFPFPGLGPAGGDLPGGVVDFWPLSAEMGLEDERTGLSLLVVTEAPEPPPVNATYVAVPAEMGEGDQAGGGLVRVVAVVATRPTDRGEVRECEFEAEDDSSTLSPDDLAGRAAGRRPRSLGSTAYAPGPTIGMGAGEAGESAP